MIPKISILGIVKVELTLTRRKGKDCGRHRFWGKISILVLDVLNLEQPSDLQLKLSGGKWEVGLEFMREVLAGVMEQARRPFPCCVTVVQSLSLSGPQFSHGQIRWLDSMLSKQHLPALVFFYSNWQEMEPGARGCLYLLHRPISPSLDDFLLRSPPPTDSAQQLRPRVQILENVVGKEHSSAPTPPMHFLASLGSFRKTMQEPHREGMWVRKGQLCSGVI